MINKIKSILAVVLLLASVSSAHAATSPTIDLEAFNFSIDVRFFDVADNHMQTIILESDVAFDESEVRTQQRGTENWQESPNQFLRFTGHSARYTHPIFSFI